MQAFDATLEQASASGVDVSESVDALSSFALRKAVAPSEMSGERVFKQLFKQDSRTYIWRVHFRRPRHRSSRDARMPAGFPELKAFWDCSRSTRVFAFGFHTYKELYPASGWTRWLPVRDAERADAECPTQALRARILERPLREWTRTQHRIFKFTVDNALWASTPRRAMGARLRCLYLWQRARSVWRVRKYAKAWLAYHDACISSACSQASTRSNDDGCLSPSLRNGCMHEYM